MRRRISHLVVLVATLLLVTPRAAHAHYDDVHYGLTYYIARVVGYTPMQAHRVASLCVMVDYAPETEPTQIENGLAALWQNKGDSLPVLGPRVVQILNAMGLSPNDSRLRNQIEKLADDVDELARKPEIAAAFEAQWRFHAFRDVIRFKDAQAGIPNPNADAAIRAQHDVLWKEAMGVRNPGVFMHFFQDEVPHASYLIGGGHWVLRPGNLPLGGTTDWLSHRSVQSNLDLVQGTAQHLIEFMRLASKGKQKPLVASADEVVQRLRNAIDDLRRVNPAPKALPTLLDVLKSKAFEREPEQTLTETDTWYAKHKEGPDFDKALFALDNALQMDGMTEVVVPRKPLPYVPFKNANTPGATVPELHERVLFCSVNVRINDPKADRPAKVEVVIRSIPTQKGEKPAVLGTGFFSSPAPDEMSGKTAIDIHDVPVGDVEIEARYIDREGKIAKSAKRKGTLNRAINDISMAPAATGGRFVLTKVLVNPNNVQTTQKTASGETVFSYGVNQNSIKYTVKKPDGTVVTGMSSNQYQPPPTVLHPGDTLNLEVTGAFTLGDGTMSDFPEGNYGAKGARWSILSSKDNKKICQIIIDSKVPPNSDKVQIIQSNGNGGPVGGACIFEYTWIGDGQPDPPNALLSTTVPAPAGLIAKAEPYSKPSFPTQPVTGGAKINASAKHDPSVKPDPNGNPLPSSTKLPSGTKLPLGLSVTSLVGGSSSATEVRPDSRGSLAGLKVGDIFLMIDDVDVSTKDSREVSDLLFTPAAKKLKVKRGAETLVLTLPAQIVP